MDGHFLSSIVTPGAIYLVGICGALCLVGVLWFIYASRRAALLLRDSKGKTIVGFFHPYCNAGGGGERVLWCGIRGLQRQCMAQGSTEDILWVVYTGDDADDMAILSRARDRFGIALPLPVHFVRLKRRRYVEDGLYPVLTMVGQALGSMILGWEAACALPPHVMIDTMGYAFAYPVFSLFSATVTTYTHYPIVSTDMISSIQSRFRRGGFTKRLYGHGKRVYYQLFAAAYGIVGRHATGVMVNSSWTKAHIDSLWNVPSTTVVYPPCDTTNLQSIPLDWEERERAIISIAQFRAEKNHPLQIRAFASYVDMKKRQAKGSSSSREGSNEDFWESTTLVLIGSCRGPSDEKRCEELRALAKELGVEDRVRFCVNVSYEELKQWFARARVGLHTMWCEHFGIGVVEMMAAGVITIAHNSGGPKEDIIGPSLNGDEQDRVGYLASKAEEYAKHIDCALRMSTSRASQMQNASRAWVERFSEESFERGFVDAMWELVEQRMG